MFAVSAVNLSDLCQWFCRWVDTGLIWNNVWHSLMFILCIIGHYWSFLMCDIFTKYKNASDCVRWRKSRILHTCLHRVFARQFWTLVMILYPLDYSISVLGYFIFQRKHYVFNTYPLSKILCSFWNGWLAKELLASQDGLVFMSYLDSRQYTVTEKSVV
jgi:hypothetical protein